ncbi:MAG: DUF1269 domain-containing protein [Coriobacteriia bacterium]
MAVLVAMAYPGDPDGAPRAQFDLQRLSIYESSHLEDAVIVTVDERGRTHLAQAKRPTSEGAIYGAFIGLALGVAVAIPLASAPVLATASSIGGGVLGLVIGALVGRSRDTGIADDFVRTASANLPPRSSALFVLLEGEATLSVLDELATCGGEVLTTDLPSEAAQRLRLAARRAQRKRSSAKMPAE